MKHMLSFDTEAQYQSAKSVGFDPPNVSYVRSSGVVHYLKGDSNHFRLNKDSLESGKVIK